MEVNNLSAIFRVISFFFFHYKFDCVYVLCVVFYFLFSFVFFMDSHMVVLLWHARSAYALAVSCKFAATVCVCVCVRDDVDIVYVTLSECLGIVVLCRHSHLSIEREREIVGQRQRYDVRECTHTKWSHLCCCYCCDAGYLYGCMCVSV